LNDVYCKLNGQLAFKVIVKSNFFKTEDINSSNEELSKEAKKICEINFLP